MNFPTSPGELGHEGWGTVDAVGEGVVDFAPGQRVALLGTNSYAEFDLCSADKIIPLPEALAGVPFPGEPFGCAMNIFRRSDIQPGQTVSVVGIGFLGALLVRLASNAGARVIAISRRQESLELAKRMGADSTIPMHDHYEIIDHVKQLTSGKLCERVIEAVGKQWPLDIAAEITGEGGRLVIAGYHQDGPRQVNMQLWNWRGFDVVNAHERDTAIQLQGVREAMAAAASGLFDPGDVLTHAYPLEQLDRALNDTRDRPGNFVKALVRP
jgi:threonine dehydrogenase-like Zn-dependent dehydrogenase